MAESVRVAAIQMCAGISPQRNLDVIADFAAQAAEDGAQYVLTPEVSIAFARDREQLSGIAVPFAGNEAISRCSAIAAQHKIYLHLGSLAIASGDGRFINRSVLFGPDGGIVSLYDKIHLFDADPPNDRPYRESDSYKAGSEAVVTRGPGFRLGMSICYDVRFPRLYQTLAEAGADVIAVPAAFTVPTGKAHWEVLLRARAIETGSFVIAAAQGGVHENGRATWGHSVIINPWGDVIAMADSDTPGIIAAEIDLTRIADARQRLPVLANARPFSLSVNLDMQQ